MKGGENEMLSPQMRLDLARERRARDIEEAARMRLIGSRPMSLRRSLGYSIIRIGERLAAEPSLELARPR
jgi:hypothetical protein